MENKTMILQGIPEDTKSGFKSACARRNRSMKSVVILLMQGMMQNKIDLSKLEDALKRHDRNN